jgi:phage terminase large subunit GpA-like protein
LALLPAKPLPILEWAKANIVIPDGPYKGQQFDPDLQPFARLLLLELGKPLFNRFVCTGPTQTGKSLICYVIPVLYHLFAIGETVVAGLPTADIADDKWNMDFLPVIEASPTLRELLPSSGAGSRNGKVRTRVRFKNGATLRFMSGGGTDKTRAGFTSRVLAVTEVDGLERSAVESKEADKLKQLEARQRAFLAQGTVTYLECTVTTSDGRIWSEYQGGTASRIARPCPHCGDYVTPEREHLKGWQHAENEIEARETAAWHCPGCGKPWTEQQRRSANLSAVLVHHGQEVDSAGCVSGSPPRTKTLGFRWTAVDNHLATAADVAADEWLATREHDRENAEKELRQFVHCLPYDPPDIELTPLDPEQVRNRTTKTKKGICPNGTIGISVGIDTGKRSLHWTAIGWQITGAGQIIDYGMQTVEADRLGIKAGLLAALHSLSSYFGRGWQSEGGKLLHASQVWIDSGYHEHQEPVYDFCNEANQGLPFGSERYRPTKGYGEGQRRMSRYYAPAKTNSEVRLIAPGYHLARSRGRVLLVHINSDHWKTELHNRLGMPADAPTAITLYEAADPAEHKEFAEQLTAERQLEKWQEGRGETIVWERMRRQNHFLDSTYSAAAGGHFVLSLRPKAAANQNGTWFANQSRKAA